MPFKRFLPLVLLCLSWHSMHANSWTSLLKSPTAAAHAIGAIGSTLAHWLIALSPSITYLYMQSDRQNEMEKLPNAPVELTNLVKETLKIHAYPEEFIANLAVKIGNRYDIGYSTIHKGLPIITIPCFHILKDIAVEKENVQCMVLHTVAQLDHTNLLKNYITGIAAPIISHTLVNSITKPLATVCNPYIPQALQYLSKIPSGYAKAMVAGLLLVGWMKYRDYQANLKAAEQIKDPQALDQIAQLFLEDYKLHEECDELDPQERGTWKRFISDELYARNYMNSYSKAQIFSRAAQEQKALRMEEAA
jgi:hypothetical protein